jgi:hypothetical protein
MTRITTYLTLLLLFFITSIIAQNKNFEANIKNLAVQIDEVVKTEKALLKEEIKTIEKQYNNEKISYEEAEKQKKTAAKLHANKIKNKISSIEEQVHSLVQGKVDTKVKEIDNNKYKMLNLSFSRDSIYNNKRTYSTSFVAFGLNNLINDGDFATLQDSEFEFGASHFFEFGLNFKTRLLKKSGLLYANYGLSLRYNNLRPKDKQYFVTNNEETLLQDHALDLKSSRFKNVQLVLPVMFELDFSKPRVENDKTVYHRNRNFRIGFGGFGGFNLKTKQILRYDLDGKKVRDKEKGDFNVNNFVYGVQGLIGYRDTSFYVKYDLQNLFTDSFKNQKNISFGVRFEL